MGILLSLQILYDLIKQVIEEFVGVLMHWASEEFILFLEFGDEGSGGNNTLI